MEIRKLENLVHLRDGREQPCHDFRLCTLVCISGLCVWLVKLKPGQSAFNVGKASQC